MLFTESLQCSVFSVQWPAGPATPADSTLLTKH